MKMHSSEIISGCGLCFGTFRGNCLSSDWQASLLFFYNFLFYFSFNENLYRVFPLDVMTTLHLVTLCCCCLCKVGLKRKWEVDSLRRLILKLGRRSGWDCRECCSPLSTPASHFPFCRGFGFVGLTSRRLRDGYKQLLKRQKRFRYPDC